MASQRAQGRPLRHVMAGWGASAHPLGLVPHPPSDLPRLGIRRDPRDPPKDAAKPSIPCHAAGVCCRSPKDVLPFPIARGREDGLVDPAELLPALPGPRGWTVSSRDRLSAYR